MGKSKYSYNRSYFKNINDEYKAYWLGFLCADACIEDNIKRRIHRVVITLNPKDINHLEKLSNEIEFSGKVKHIVRNYNHKNSTKNKVESAILSIPGKEIVYDLDKHGCGKNKTKDLSLPKLDQKLKRHFIRGFFDGDGCLTKTKDLYWRIQFSCNFKIATEIKELFKNELNIDIGKITKMKNIYSISKQKKDEVKTILNYLYQDSNIYLDRKYDLYKIALLEL